MTTAEKVQPRLKERYRNEIRDSLLKQFGYGNVMQIPTVTKVVVNMGVGEAARDAKLVNGAVNDLALITGQRGEALKRRLRTGTVVTNGDRNWELRFSQERKRINLSRAIAVDMESGTVAAQGLRLRVPYGTLLCVSDKPLHGEIKLPGAANARVHNGLGV